jgi:hypothetical protein
MSTTPWQWTQHDGDTCAAFFHEGQPMDLHFVTRTVHQVAPIRAVILDTYLDETADDWTRWSELRAPRPDAPAFTDDVDDEFERARRRDDQQDDFED